MTMGELVVKLDASVLLCKVCLATKDSLFQSTCVVTNWSVSTSAMVLFVRLLTCKAAGDPRFAGNIYGGTSTAAICISEWQGSNWQAAGMDAYLRQ